MPSALLLGFTGVPLIINQGAYGPIVAPDSTARLVAELCGNGEVVDYRVLAGIWHLDAGHVAAPDVDAWIADRFAGEAAPDTCDAI